MRLKTGLFFLCFFYFCYFCKLAFIFLLCIFLFLNLEWCKNMGEDVVVKKDGFHAMKNENLQIKIST